MKGLYDHVVERILGGFISGDPELLRSIGLFEGELEVQGDALAFTLPALFEFACRSYRTGSGRTAGQTRKDYLRFRQALYRNPTNSRLMERGGRVELAALNEDHDLVLFRLVRNDGIR